MLDLIKCWPCFFSLSSVHSFFCLLFFMSKKNKYKHENILLTMESEGWFHVKIVTLVKATGPLYSRKNLQGYIESYFEEIKLTIVSDISCSNSSNDSESNHSQCHEQHTTESTGCWISIKTDRSIIRSNRIRKTNPSMVWLRVGVGNGCWITCIFICFFFSRMMKTCSAVSCHALMINLRHFSFCFSRIETISFSWSRLIDQPWLPMKIHFEEKD